MGEILRNISKDNYFFQCKYYNTKICHNYNVVYVLSDFKRYMYSEINIYFFWYWEFRQIHIPFLVKEISFILSIYNKYQILFADNEKFICLKYRSSILLFILSLQKGVTYVQDILSNYSSVRPSACLVRMITFERIDYKFCTELYFLLSY